MIYLKSIFAGAAAAILSLVAMVLIFLTIVLSRTRLQPEGGIDAVSFDVGPVIWLVEALAFAAGFWWEFRRARMGKPFMHPLALAALVLLLLVAATVLGWSYRPTLEYGWR